MSEDNSNEREEIEVRHTYSNSYELHPATGVAGGIQPQGDLKIDFVYDHNYRTTRELYDSEEGFLTGLAMEGHMEREHQVGVSMNRQDAIHSAVWMLAESLGETITREDLYDAIGDLMEEDPQ